jgi:hypothetical protein
LLIATGALGSTDGAADPPSLKWSDLKYVIWHQGRTDMPRKLYKPEEIVAKLRQVDVLVSQGQILADAIRQIGVILRLSCAQ